MTDTKDKEIIQLKNRIEELEKQLIDLKARSESTSDSSDEQKQYSVAINQTKSKVIYNSTNGQNSKQFKALFCRSCRQNLSVSIS
jgi:phage regulator Rha-like protein